MIYLLADVGILVVLFTVALGANRYNPPKEKVDKNAVRVQIPDSLLCLLPPEDRNQR